ncbi:MAG: mechanosensitive ion channel family protein [Chitinophagales bacterium]
MNRVQQAFVEFWNSIIEHLPKMVLALTVIIISLFIGIAIKRTINSFIRKKWDKSIVVTFIGEFFKWFALLIGIAIAFNLLGFGGIASSLVASAGVSAVIIGFAFKDIAENFLAGILLAVNRPFQIKDIIESNGVKGPVQKIDLRITHVRTADGRDIYIPNAMIMKSILINYTKDGLLRHDFIIGIDTSDDFNNVRKDILSYLIKQKDILKDPTPNVMVDSIGVSSVDIKVLFWVNIFTSKPINDEQGIGEPIKSRVINDVKELLLKKGYSLPSNVIEHKMYKADEALKIEINNPTQNI